MKAIFALLVLAAAAADFLHATMEIHHEAVLPFLEAEDQALIKRLNDPEALVPPSPRPSSFPTFKPGKIPKPIRKCVRRAVICHKKAGEDACLHLCCLYATGKCIKESVKIDPAKIPEKVKFCGILTAVCMKHSPSCEEKLCCVVRFAECTGLLGERS